MAVYLPVEVLKKLHPRNYRYVSGQTQLIEEGVRYQLLQVRLPAGNILVIDAADLVADADNEIAEVIRTAQQMNER